MKNATTYQVISVYTRGASKGETEMVKGTFDKRKDAKEFMQDCCKDGMEIEHKIVKIKD